MADELDLSNAVDMLKNMLSNDEGQQQIQNIMSMLGGDGGQRQQTPNTQNAENIEMMMKLQKVMSAVNDAKHSSQADFLHSLAPLLRPERRDKLNKAVRLLGVGRAIEIMKQT